MHDNSGADPGAGITWPTRTTPPHLLPDAVHVWATALDVAPARRAELYATLAADERARAARFVSDQHAARYTVARGVLRTLLGAYLGQPPSSIRFSHDEHGKPALAPAEHPGGPHFNVTHSAGLALYVVTPSVPIGVDVEEVITFADMAAVADGFFSPYERQVLSMTPPHAFPRTFYGIWTRKEAFLKADGIGLLAPLDSFDVSAPPNAPALLRLHNRPAAPALWSFTHLEPTAHHVRALALSHPQADVWCRRWPA